MSIAQNIVQLKTSLPQGVTLVAVSKFHPVEALWEAYNAGQRVFGESRAQELSTKQKVLPEDIEWHFIGPLQSNTLLFLYLSAFVNSVVKVPVFKSAIFASASSALIPVLL